MLKFLKRPKYKVFGFGKSEMSSLAEFLKVEIALEVCLYFSAALVQELEAFNKGLRLFVFPFTVLWSCFLSSWCLRGSESG